MSALRGEAAAKRGLGNEAFGEHFFAKTNSDAPWLRDGEFRHLTMHDLT